jgi:16S rRNA (cytidine1402-2'-O)-methyltransferase
MLKPGNLFLIPNIIADHTADQVVTPQLKAILPQIRFFLVENVRTARRYLSSLKVYDSVENLNFSVLDKDTKPEDLKTLFEPLLQGNDLGVISESGCPGVADPGALAAQYAHQHAIRVVPLVGPSSLLLALMASGLNGQKFAFHGYLPIDQKEAIQALKNFEKESKLRQQTQIFIETPYRNNSIFQVLTRNLAATTMLTIAVDLTSPQESVLTKTVEKWRATEIILPKSPAVFLFLA